MDVRFANDASPENYIKGAIGVGAIAAAGDKFLLGEPNLYKSLMFGGAVALGTYAGPVIGQKLQILLVPKPTKPTFETVMEAALLDLRLKQFGGSAVSAFLVNNLILNKSFQFSQLALVAGSYLAKEGILTAMNISAHNSKHKK
jgi:hypothetical protein